MTLLVAWFRLRARDGKLLRVQDVIAFAAFAVLYPLAVIDTNRTALWMQIFYLLMLFYICALVLRSRLPGEPRQ
jgi:hypothetical protein